MIRVIYHCSGGAYFSAVAAAVHLARLPADRLPNNTELMAVEGFCPAAKANGDTPGLGRLMKAGIAAVNGSDVIVYFMGRGFYSPIIQRTLAFSPVIINPGAKSGVTPVNIDVPGQIMSSVGNWMCKYALLRSLGAYLACYAVKSAYPKIILKVKGVYEQHGGTL
jgi:hypothetical protein